MQPVVLATLRAYDQTTPIVLFTAFGDHLTHFEAMNLGASAVLDKRFDLDDLLALLWKLYPAPPS